MKQELLVVGLSYRTAAIAVRERLAFPEEEIAAAVGSLTGLPTVGEALLVSTCNRVEVYAATRGGAGAANADEAVEALRRKLVESRGVPLGDVTEHLYAHVGPAAIKHVFRVASSLDSLVVGEPQILGQLKDAYGVAAKAGCVGPLLSRCLERAWGVAKRVRTETAIARGAANVSSVAVELAKNIFGELAGRRVLVIGAGKMSALAARHLRNGGVDEILVTNRTAARAQALADEVDGVARPYEQLEALLVAADIVVSSTGARQPVIARELMKRVVKARRRRPLFLIDIAVPRDVEPSVGKLDGVYLFDIDDLERVVQENLSERRKEAEAAERIVEAEAAQFVAWMRSQGVVPTIKDLRERFTQVARAEAEKVAGQLSGQGKLDDKMEKALRQLADGIVNKLLHTPLTALKTPDSSEATALVAATRRLFALPEEMEAAGDEAGQVAAQAAAAEKRAIAVVGAEAAGVTGAAAEKKKEG